MPSGKLIQLGLEVMEYVVHAFGRGDLTTDGLQYGTAVASTSTDSGDAKSVELQTIQPFTLADYGATGAILEMEFALTAAVKSSTDAAAKVAYKWRAKETDLSSTCWVDLKTWCSTAVGTSFADVTDSGYFDVQTNLANFPIDVQLIIYDGTAGSTQASAKVKSNSYVRVLYRVQ